VREMPCALLRPGYESTHQAGHALCGAPNAVETSSVVMGFANR
jgi:hypothetical protein